MKITVVLALVSSALAGFVSNSTCPNTGVSVHCPKDGFNTCAGDSLSTNIIIRCADSANGVCPQPGNCNDNLAGVPPVGVKTDAKCWQESPTAGNAQCVFNCVAVTKLDGTKFYPLGCTSASSSSSTASSTSTSTSSAPPKSSSTKSVSSSTKSVSNSTMSVSSTHPHSSESKTYSHHSSGYHNSTYSHHSHTGTGTHSHTYTHTGTYVHTKTKSTSATITKTKSGGGSVYTTSSTTYYTTTLPGGVVSTGSSVVAYTTTAAATTTGPVLSNNAMGVEAQGLLGIAIAGLVALI